MRLAKNFNWDLLICMLDAPDKLFHRNMRSVFRLTRPVREVFYVIDDLLDELMVLSDFLIMVSDLFSFVRMSVLVGCRLEVFLGSACVRVFWSVLWSVGLVLIGLLAGLRANYAGDEWCFLGACGFPCFHFYLWMDCSLGCFVGLCWRLFSFLFWLSVRFSVACVGC